MKWGGGGGAAAGAKPQFRRRAFLDIPTTLGPDKVSMGNLGTELG